MFLVAELFGKLAKAPSRRTGRSGPAGERDQLPRQIAFDEILSAQRAIAAIERARSIVQAAGGQEPESQRTLDTRRGAQRRRGDHRQRMTTKSSSCVLLTEFPNNLIPRASQQLD